MGTGGAAIRRVAAAFPGSLDARGGIDRQSLGRLVFGDPAALRRLEVILHPMVRAAEGAFLRRCCRAGQPLAVLDIPLLLETGGEARVDRVVVVSAPPLLQRQRALRRPGMTDVKLAQIRAKQVADATKRRRADHIIPSGQDRGLLVATVRRIIAEARDLPPGVWPGRWLEAVELVNHLPTGRTFHAYLNPERDVPEEAFRVHGLSAEFLADHPVFAEVVDAFLEFLGDARLVIHNAAFDVRFLNAELARCGRPTIPNERAVDTLLLAQRRFPGASNNLDALCKRFGVDNSNRKLHDALLDCELLADVYLHLLGGRQAGLDLGQPTRTAAMTAV